MNEPTSSTSPIALDLALALGGPATLGLTLGLTGVSANLVAPALIVPAAIVGTTALMLPALYIGSALAGTDVTAREMGKGTLGALREAGLGCVGLAPAILFLGATSSSGGGALAVGFALALAVALGFRGLYSRLFGPLEVGPAKAKAVLVFAGWTLVAFGIGARLTLPAFV